MNRIRNNEKNMGGLLFDRRRFEPTPA